MSSYKEQDDLDLQRNGQTIEPSSFAAFIVAVTSCSTHSGSFSATQMSASLTVVQYGPVGVIGFDAVRVDDTAPTIILSSGCCPAGFTSGGNRKSMTRHRNLLTANSIPAAALRSSVWASNMLSVIRTKIRTSAILIGTVTAIKLGSILLCPALYLAASPSHGRDSCLRLQATTTLILLGPNRQPMLLLVKRAFTRRPPAQSPPLCRKSLLWEV
ncbi:hypothetical protein MAPG_07092 [Magnaporthiopsis poae ATCC 64411]|uniref:Uncharacterized protein n=1 Tax=Magnaporthiopsis poae (strain ATCC 64411 / 73-15) TaxID=644358 RepID=A0A0C4E3S3_MAGP6|nr:hypothetical protein MAPG_07092 [Magnaporthiopsis poae ATCC 64411]